MDASRLVHLLVEAAPFLLVLAAISSWMQVRDMTGRTTGIVERVVYAEQPPPSDGIVLDERDATGSRGNLVRLRSRGRPVIRFRAGGSEFRFRPSVVTRADRRIAIGAKVPVAFNPNAPTEADIATPWRLVFGPVLLTVLSAGWLAARFL